MNKLAVRACPVCTNGSVEVLHSQQFVLPAGHFLANGYDVVACISCGFVYADTGSPQQAYDGLYQDASKYQDTKTSTGGGESAWDAERLSETARTISKIVADQTKSILDVGCANGGLLAALRAMGHTSSTGMDPAAACVSNTVHRGFEAHVGSLSSLPSGHGTFDVVVLSHVLEHVRDLHPALIGLRQLLHSGSLAYIEVPDASRYCDFVNAPFQDFNTEHINHFSGICLNNLTQQFGLSPIVPCSAKVVRSSVDTLYPAVFGVFQCADANARTITKDHSLRDRIVRYKEISADLMRSMNSHLHRELAGSSELVLWGTGQLAMKLLNEEPLRTANIRACVDANPVNHGKQLRGIPIVSPGDLTDIQCPIVITTTLHETDIRRDIRAMGIVNRLISLRMPGFGSGAAL